MRVLFIGDIVGSPGRRIVLERLTDLVSNEKVDLVIANCENAASGFGVTPRLVEELLGAGCEVLTGGNHIWDRKEILEYVSQEPRLLRPANFAAGNPGRGVYCGTARNGVPYAVLNLQGRVFMAANDCPFRVADRELAALPADVKVIVVDFHAEATSEKQSMGWYLDGRVSAVIGTHTHVATADARVLPQGTAFITDAGMTGPHNSVIGMDKKAVLQRFLDGLPARFEVAEGDIRMNTVLLELDPATGHAQSIEHRSLSDRRLAGIHCRQSDCALWKSCGCAVHPYSGLRRIFACRFLPRCAESRLARALLGAWDHRRRIRGDLNRASGHRERIEKGRLYVWAGEESPFPQLFHFCGNSLAAGIG